MPETQTQTPPPAQPPGSSTTSSGGPEKDARMWCMLCHLAMIIPCIPCVLTILVWQLKKAEFPSVDIHGKRALNFQISLFIIIFALWIVSFMLSVIHLAILAMPLMLLIFLAWLGGVVLAILAGIKANNGEDAKYPWSLTLVK